VELGFLPLSIKEPDSEDLMNYLDTTENCRETFKCKVEKCGYKGLNKHFLENHIKKVHGFKNQSSFMELQNIKEQNQPEGKFCYYLNYVIDNLISNYQYSQ
jgi:hypothetical protein